MKPWKTNFTALLIAETLAMIGFGISNPVIPLFLGDDIGITDPIKLKTWVGVIQSAAAVTLAIFAPIWGHLADSFSRRAMLLRAMFGGAVIISLMTFSHSPWHLLILKSIQGCLTGTVAAATVLTAGISPISQIAFTLGLLQTGVAVGNSLGPMVGGVIADFIGNRAAFFATGVTLALAGLVVLKWVEDDIRPIQVKQTKKISLMPDFRPIAGSSIILTLLLVNFGVSAANTVTTPMLPLFLKDLALKFSREPMYIGSSTGIVMGVGAAATALATVLVGKFSPRVGYWKTLFICICGGTLMTIPQAFVTNMVQLTIIRTIACFFLGGTPPTLDALLMLSTKKESQGSVYGLNSSLASTGNALGPLIGSVVAIVSYRWTFLATALILGVSAFGIGWRRKYSKSR